MPVSTTLRSLRLTGDSPSPAAEEPVLHPPTSVLVGGATGVGKSTVAAALARHFDIPRVVTTDVVREILRAVVPHATAPALHVSSFEAGGVAGFLAQASAVAPGIEALFRRAAVEGTGTILEGVHLVPGITPTPGVPTPGPAGVEREAIVVPLVIVVDDAEAHRSYLVARAAAAAHRPAERYLERFDDIRRIQGEIVRRAEEHGVPTVRSTSLDATIAAAIEVAAARLAGHERGAAAAEHQPSPHVSLS